MNIRFEDNKIAESSVNTGYTLGGGGKCAYNKAFQCFIKSSNVILKCPQLDEELKFFVSKYHNKIPTKVGTIDKLIKMINNVIKNIIMYNNEELIMEVL